MAIERKPWPADPASKFEVEKMIRFALVAEPTWQAPAGFEYTQRGGSIQLQASGAQVKTHIRKLFNKLPEQAKYMYYADAVMQGADYGKSAVAALAENKLLDPTWIAQIRNWAQELVTAIDQLPKE
jgi:hypothetical protein